MHPDEDEEELRAGAERLSRRLPDRLRRPAMVVLVAAAGLAAAFVSTRIGGDDTTEAGPSRAVASSSAPSSSTTAPTEVAITPEPFPPTSVPSCPSTANCRTVVGDLPAATVAALRERYPGAAVTSSSTLIRANAVGTVLLRRALKVVAGPRRLEIVIGPFVLGPDSFDRQNTGRASTVTVESTGSGKTVSILLTEPRVTRPNDLTVLRLARDPRLAALR